MIINRYLPRIPAMALLIAGLFMLQGALDRHRDHHN
jgi:hypothetical protein